PLPKRLDSAKLIVRRVVDQRWTSLRSSEPHDGDSSCPGKCKYEFDTVVFDGTAQSSVTVGLSAGADTLSADPAQGTGKVHLVLKIDKDLDSVVIGMTGGFVSALPTLTGSATVTQTDSGLTVTPNAPGTSATTVVMDIPLQGLVIGRAITVTGTGQKS